MKTKIVIRLADDIQCRYEEELKEERESGKRSPWLKGLEKGIEILKLSPNHGERVSRKEHEPAYTYFTEKFHLQSTVPDWLLYRMQRPGYWRMSYTILTGVSAEKTVFIMEYTDHDKYNESYGY
jgi:hypothetical protein